ncbi:NAD-dependent epimerase/dehydratase family protein [Thermobispora bispora]|jgi:UDP-glucose 4-epimerase|uniref:NAD-dependent epimerase/dehydratase n=1 Tax=Thermobispora bispora (strain ATCC 19993 / DSM 43833 / CBS 139.67 / JCM 10125 / KCTC 9307 / NBRC 14880 / R51) TaxID=469371 RepID=D6Y3F5_THEBD|nr:NAD-dependent epimerase/dehydratase family protein [Thermobispora bispora]MBO2474467.1 NAD-dependent dehydratase [Actinomycetales bacterium]MDI9579610.1 NAD-dependent epimerase/dehydratase family protein [Thermobispora sp.]ADG86984.1 NAD-dependent epimerase/dehydratase [Thermobispora bispora DSM 43833]MBX6167900.1 NAD-dependent epimerase/dehydratase family protein [Thermobispora bispora]QSI46963.1 NAD-dependent epimerase/dehydratase family protein [Thermobispora bispora]
MGRTVLVTGVSRHIGARVASALAADPDVHRVIGVDTAPPVSSTAPPLGRVEFVRLDLRGLDLAQLIADSDIDTVVHLGLLSDPAGSRPAMREYNIIGTMQVLAACQRSRTVRRVVVRSTTAVYGSSPASPAVCTETTEPADSPHHGYERDAIEVEGYARGFARRRPDVATTILRFAPMLGPRVETPLTRYFSLPVLPTVLGFDPRLQFVHEDDVVDVLCRMAREELRGVFNVAGDGVLLLSQCARRAGKPVLPLPSAAFHLLGTAVRSTGLIDFSPEQIALLSHGRVADTTALAAATGWRPKYGTAAAFDDFIRARGLGSDLPARVFDLAADLIRGR